MNALAHAGMALALLLGGPEHDAHGVRSGRLHAAATPPGAELVRTIPITPPTRTEPRVVLSLGPRRIGPLRPGARLRLYGEVQVSLTCVDPKLPRCIGRSYGFNPRITGRLRIAPGGGAAPESVALPVGAAQTVRCRSKPIADRNHHCVLVFDEEARVPRRSTLPCPPSACHVNMTLRATSRHARRGNRVVIGADERSGAVRRNKGRLAAVVTAPGFRPGVYRARTTRVLHRELPERQDGGRRVVYSIPLPSLHRGDAIAAVASQVTDIDHLPYAAYVSDQLVLARSPGATRPARPSPAQDGGYLTAPNGFNCTHGPSAYRSPCIARKAGALGIVRPPRRGRYYVNLVSRSKPKHAPGQPGEVARVLQRGFLEVARYR